MLVEPRSTWGARYPDGDQTLYGLASGVRIHHSVTTTLPPTATMAQECAEMRALENVGQQRFGTGISYNVLIFPSGRAYQGVSWDRRGTHDEGENTPTRAICFAGDFDAYQPTSAAIRTAAAIVAAGRGVWWTASAPVTGHRDHYPTACPGQHVYDRLGEIRSGTITQEDDMTPDQAAKLDQLYWALNNSILPALGRIDRAAGKTAEPVDVDALAQRITPALTGPLVDALTAQGATGLTPEQVRAATEDAVRAVFADAATEG